MKFDRSLFVKTAETQVSEDGTLFVYVDEETLESTGRVLIKSKTSSGGALFYADGTPQQWIPVTERLPEKEGEVLVTTSWDNVCMAWYNNGKWRAEYINGYDDDEILAWMPLPKRYKPESEDKE